MDRLTATDKTGRIGLDCGECEKPGYECVSCDNLRRAIDRLAAYEDTGLTPEEILQMTKIEVIPIRVMERAIAGINAAEICDQAGRYDYELRRAIKTVMNWYRAPVFLNDEVRVSKSGGWIPNWYPEAALGRTK